MTKRNARIEQTIEALVYAPIGVGLYLKDMGPTFVNMFVARGRAEIDRRHAEVQQRATTARSIGQVALTFGLPMVRQRVEREVDTARKRAQTLLGTLGGVPEAPPRAPEPRPAPPVQPSVPTAPAPAPAPMAGSNGNGVLATDATLPIPGYDALSASQVVERLAGLASDELEAVRAYEGSHRKRRTILGKIDQISA